MSVTRQVATLVCAIAAVCVLAGRAHAGVEDDLRDGDRYFESSDWQRAASAFDRAITKAPGQVSAEAWGKRAAIFIILHRYEPGLAFIARAETWHPKAPEVLEQKALILWELGRRDDAIGVAENVVSARPSTFSNQKLVGEYYASRDPARAATAYEAYLAHRPANLESGDVLPRLRLGFAYLSIARTAIAGAAEAKARAMFRRAAAQLELVARRFGSRPNAQPNADNGLCAAYTGLERFDQAIAVCERVVADRKHVDATGSAWFNLATAYAKRKNTSKARAAANEFVKLRKTEARGYRLLGDIAFDRREWTVALDDYTRAEQLARASQRREKSLIAIGLGKTYRRLPKPNIALAIEKLSNAYAAAPTDIDLARELAGAYVEGKQDAKAAALAEALIGGALVKARPEIRAEVAVTAGKARYNLHELAKSRRWFEEARRLLPRDIAVRRLLVTVIDAQAIADDKAGGKQSRALVTEALAIDPQSPQALRDAAVLAIAHGDCDRARDHLGRLSRVRGHDSTMRLRLLARTYVCGSKPDLKRAASLYASALKGTRGAGHGAMRAEIETELASLFVATAPDEAVGRYETALRYGGKDPQVGPAARRGLALALYHRGWKRLRQGSGAAASSDLDRASRVGADPDVLRGTEATVFELSRNFAAISTNRATEAARRLRALAARGELANGLAPSYARVPQLLVAYADYRTGSLAARIRASRELAKLESAAGPLAPSVRGLIAATWEAIAVDRWRAGNPVAAKRALITADRYATGDTKRRIALDTIAASIDRRNPRRELRALEKLGANPLETLVDLGIVYDLLGRPKQAVEMWQRARGRVQVRELPGWIETKKRMFGL